MAHGVGPPHFIVNVRDGEDVAAISSKNSDSAIAAVDYNPRETRKDRMQKYEKFQSS